MTGRPASWAVGRVGACAVSIVIVGSEASWDGSGDGTGLKTEDPSCCWKGLREFPYLAGGPARIWHLADSTPVGCRGFIGPVPPPLLIRALQLCADRTGRTRRVSTTPRSGAVRYCGFGPAGTHFRFQSISSWFHSSGTTEQTRPVATWRPGTWMVRRQTRASYPGRPTRRVSARPHQPGERANGARSVRPPDEAGIGDCSASLEAIAQGPQTEASSA